MSDFLHSWLDVLSYYYSLTVQHCVDKMWWNSYIMLVADSPMVLVYYEWRLYTEYLEGLADQRSSCTW